MNPLDPPLPPPAGTPLAPRPWERLFAPVDIAPLVWFRVAFGLIMMYEVWRYFDYQWITRYFIEPKFFFTYYGFSWVHPWPGPWMNWHFVGLAVLAGAMTVGLFYRLAAMLFFLAFTYVFLLDQTRYLNHFYLVCLFGFLFIFVPAHRAFSLDAWFRPRLRTATVPAWTLGVLRAQLCLVYFMGGVAKLNGDWLRGEPMRMWLRERTDFPLIGRYFTEDWMVYGFAYGGLLFDLGIAPLVIWRRTRWFAFGLAAVFNMMNARLFHIGIFPWLALGATVLLFISPAWLPRPFPKLWRQAGTTPDAVPGDRAVRSRAQQATSWLLAAWLAFQTLVPLRHLWFYPGNPEWTEEGHRFAWRMKLRSKDASIQVLARDPATGKSWTVDPLDFLTERQLDDASDHPDMILQIAHEVAARWQRAHGTPIEVRIVAHASLNGRRKELLINPDVDLATQPRTLNPEKWILPLTTPLDVVEDNEESGVQIKTIPTRQPSPVPIRSVPTRQPSPAAIQE